MRNKLIHEYFGVDVKAVWITATHDLPRLQHDVTLLLSSKGAN